MSDAQKIMARHRDEMRSRLAELEAMRTEAQASQDQITEHAQTLRDATAKEAERLGAEIQQGGIGKDAASEDRYTALLEDRRLCDQVTALHHTGKGGSG